jgi:hypothetical protein
VSKRVLGLVGALAALLACGEDEREYAGVEFELLSAPPIPVSIHTGGLELTAGVAVKVEATPQSSGRSYSKRDRLDLRSSGPELLAVYPSEGEDRHFVFVALRPGETCVEVLVNRHSEECIPARVRPAQ